MRWLWIFLLFTGIAYAENIKSPPPLTTEPVAEQLYFESIYVNWGNLEKTNTNPNGNRLGNKSDIILYESNLLEYFLAVNIDGLYHWWAIELDDIL